MIKKLLFPLLLIAGIFCLADEGDTIVVQTIDFNTPVNPGWNAPREGYYQFPADSLSFSKILMVYTLKCDPTQSPACGEWDYTTHTRLYDHTGTYDSNLYYHPNYIAGGSSPDSFMYMDDVSWKYRSWLEYSNNTTPAGSAYIGIPSGILQLSDPAGSSGRHQFIFTADELIGAGLSAGDVTGLQIAVTETGGVLEKFCLRLAPTELDSINPGSIVNDGLVNVYKADHSFGSAGWNIFPFAYPFNWDGSSNILVDISYEGDENPEDIWIDAHMAGFPAGISSLGPNTNLYFHQGDKAVVPVDGLSTLDSAITISFWAKGNWLQPLNNSALEGFNDEGERVVNIHLPWSNGNVYWDCGTDGAYDRIFRGTAPEIYKGSWHHWAFTKDISTGHMWMYLDGYPYHTGSGKTKPISGITSFNIGCNGNGGNFYEGALDEICVFSTALDQETIFDWMNKSLDPTHPAYDQLLAYFPFDEGDGYTTQDISSYGVEAPLYGYPEWMDYRGSERQMNFIQASGRPNMIFENGNYDPMAMDSVVRVDTIPHGQVMIVMFEDFVNPTQPTDTLIKWPHYYNDFVFDAGGQALDSTLVPPDHILYKTESPYYVPYEILEAYELGRFITPYGIGLDLGEGFTWVYDVSDFRQFLHDTVHLSSGNFQELLDLEFHMIEGTPPRDVVSIEKMWDGYWALNAFEEKVPPITVYPDPLAEMFKLKITTSGHEFDNSTNCAEFCQKTHWVEVDSISRYEWEILDECADNPLYPQGGTWIYDRAGWCPGAKVTEQHIELSPYITGDSASIDYNCESDPYGKYSVTSFLVSYSDPNFSLDAAIDEIISPNSRKRYGRFNPLCGKPEVVIQNTGADTLYSLDIIYYPESADPQVFNWTGSLGFLEKETLTLDPINWTGWQNGHNTFIVSVENPNGGEDEYAWNNTMKSTFELSPEYPEQFIIKFRTNKVAYQNYYEILDQDGNVVFMKEDLENETVYEDTVSLADGCYTFILHDSGDNGISFWANNQGSGYIFFKDMDGGTLFYFDPDFGKFTRREFTIGLAVDLAEPQTFDYFEVYPNPSTGVIHAEYSCGSPGDIVLKIFDARGVMLHSEVAENTRSGIIHTDLSDLPQGMYFCILQSGTKHSVKKIILNK